MYVQNSPFQKKSKVKGGGTKKVCLPASKVRSMSKAENCLLYTSPSPRDATLSRMPSSA